MGRLLPKYMKYCQTPTHHTLSMVYNQYFCTVSTQNYNDCTLALLLRVNGETGSSTDPYALWESSLSYNDDEVSLTNTAVDYKSALVDTSWNKIRKVAMFSNKLHVRLSY